MRRLVLFLIPLVAAKVSYEGHQIWRLEEAGNDVKKTMQELDMDVLSIRKDSMDIHVSPAQMNDFSSALNDINVKYSVSHDNVQRLIDAEEEVMKQRPLAADLDRYHSFEEVEEYLGEVANNYTMATLSTIGQSYEGREQWQLQISTGIGTKQIIWIDCAIHAREWITVSNCLYGIDLLLNGYGQDDDVTALLDRYDFYVIPVYNPDGYSYTWTDDRLWRKSRSPNDGVCDGTDLNRNFDANWGVSGTSTQPCSQTYGGSSAASEIETQNAQSAITNLASELAAVYSFHSYSQYWLYPYAYATVDPPNVDDIGTCATLGASVLQSVYGTPYEVGTWATVLYLSSGTTIDYSYNLGVTYSYTMELRDTGEYGFELPEDQIRPTVIETWTGVLQALLCMP